MKRAAKSDPKAAAACCLPANEEQHLRSVEGRQVDAEFALLAKAVGHPACVRILPLPSGSCDPLRQRREEAERRDLREAVAKRATRTAWVLDVPEESTGPDAPKRVASPSLQTGLA